MNTRYIWEKFKLMILALEIIGFFLMAGFYAGQVHALRDMKVSYRAGIVMMELDGHQFIHIADGYVPTRFE